MRMLPAGYFFFFCSARPGRVMCNGSCFPSPGYQTTDHTRGGCSLLLQFVTTAAACRSTLSLCSDRFRRVLSICPAVQAGASPLFFILSGCTRSVLCSCCTLSCNTATTTRYLNRCPPDASFFFLSGYKSLPHT